MIPTKTKAFLVFLMDPLDANTCSHRSISEKYLSVVSFVVPLLDRVLVRWCKMGIAVNVAHR